MPYPVIEYSNGKSMSGAAQVRIFTENQLKRTFGGKLFTHTTWENVNHAENREAFLSAARAKMARLVRPGDIVAHTCGAERSLVAAFPEAIHVETGIGYAAGPGGCYRIFESESWRAWHMGRYHVPSSSGTWPDYPEITTTAVVPNYYDTSDWRLGEGARGTTPYVLYAGRMTSDKGIEIVEACAQALPEVTFFVVSGDPRSDRLTAPNIHWIGRVSSRKELAGLYGSASCVLMPSRFWEPFGGVAVESLLCGTPVVCPDYAAFVETVAHPDDGMRCMTPEDYLYALRLMLDPEQGWASQASRASRRVRAQERFGLEPARLAYLAAFDHFERLHRQGIKPL
jgi:glycosyltransferase involved in cell wall biosynthesis